MSALLKRLKRHPFPTVAWFKRVVAVSFAFPEAALRPLVPEALEIDSCDGLGFVTVSMVWTRNLRPAGFPALLGQDFFLAGYRVFTRFPDITGRSRRGLLILRSETDKQRMVWMGNLMTHYRYRRIILEVQETASATRVRTTLPGGGTTLNLAFQAPLESVELPPGSPFPDWKSARRFAGPMPYTFSPEDESSFVVIEGRRQEWTPRPVKVLDWEVGLFNETPLRGTTPILANAFTVEGIPYRWSAGRVMRPGGRA